MSHTTKSVDPEQPISAQQPPQEIIKPVPLSADPATLVDEWRRSQGFIAQVNLKLRAQQQIIETAQQTIETLKTQGLQVVGQANMVLRILAGMGVDPNKYGFSEESKPDELNLQGSLSKSPETPEVVQDKEVDKNPKLAALRNRFSRK